MRLGLSVWEPYTGLNVFNSRFHRMFEDAARALSTVGVEDVEKGNWAPSVDIYETEDGYKLRADLPGMTREDIQIDIKDNTLTIKGEKKIEDKISKDNYVRVEREYGTFVRSFALSDKVGSENIKANYKDGVLELTLPKKEEAKPKQIKVKVN